jgi:hypothetical protein
MAQFLRMPPVMEELTPELARRIQVEELWGRRVVLEGSMNARRLREYESRQLLSRLRGEDWQQCSVPKAPRRLNVGSWLRLRVFSVFALQPSLPAWLCPSSFRRSKLMVNFCRGIFLRLSRNLLASAPKPECAQTREYPKVSEVFGNAPASPKRPSFGRANRTLKTGRREAA